MSLFPILIIYFFSITFFYIKLYYKDLQVEKVWWLNCTAIIISPIILFAYFLGWMKNDFFRKYYRIEFVVTDKRYKDRQLRSAFFIARRFWFQDVVNDKTIEHCKENLKDNECFYFFSITRSSSVDGQFYEK